MEYSRLIKNIHVLSKRYLILRKKLKEIQKVATDFIQKY